MNLSQKQVLDLIKNNDSFDLNDMGFLLTVLRDNCLDEDLYKYMDLLIDELWERR